MQAVNASWYQTSQIGNRSLDFMRDSIAKGRPFLAYLGPHAPHYSADAPPWAQTLFADLAAPRTPAFNSADLQGQAEKTMHIAQNPEFDAAGLAMIDTHFRDRWRSIVGLDEMISLVHLELGKLGVLDDTFFFCELLPCGVDVFAV